MHAVRFSFHTMLASRLHALLYVLLCVAPSSFVHAENGAATLTSTVSIKSYAFSPATVTIAAGSTVTWINQDDDPHTVTGDATATVLNSSALDTHEQYSFTFAKPGIYKYFCKLHPHMQGEIIVQ